MFAKRPQPQATKPVQVHLDGQDYVILPIASYEALLAAEDVDDEAMGKRLMAERAEAIAGGTYLTMPRDQWARIRDGGESPVLVVRQYRGMTQRELSEAVDVAQSELSAIEARKRRGTVDTFLALASVLKAPVEVLAGKRDERPSA